MGMRRQVLLSASGMLAVLLTLGASLGASLAQAQTTREVATASCNPDMGGGRFEVRPVYDIYAQTFTASETGNLKRVEARIGDYSSNVRNNIGFVMEIRTVGTDGKPTHTVLGSATIPPDDVPEYDTPYVSGHFSPGVEVVEGEKYAVAFRTTSADPALDRAFGSRGGLMTALSDVCPGSDTLFLYGDPPTGSFSSAAAYYDIFFAAYVEQTLPDTTAPAISGMPADKIEEATGPDGAQVGWQTPTANDENPTNPAVSCASASGITSGGTFPIGTTTVTCEATDAAGNRGTDSFDVTVRDTTAPAITGMPQDITEEATGPNGAQVGWQAPTASDAVDASVSVGCSPASGATFALGQTTVSCTATDSRTNSDTETFSVTVEDTAAPTITATKPANKATGVRRGAPLTATFSETMNPDTLTKATFKLYKITPTGNKQVTNTTVGLGTDGLVAKLDPFGTSATLLSKNTKYKAIVTTGAMDTSDNALDQNPVKTANQQKAWTFTTGNR